MQQPHGEGLAVLVDHPHLCGRLSDAQILQLGSRGSRSSRHSSEGSPCGMASGMNHRWTTLTELPTVTEQLGPG